MNIKDEYIFLIRLQKVSAIQKLMNSGFWIIILFSKDFANIKESANSSGIIKTWQTQDMTKFQVKGPYPVWEVENSDSQFNKPVQFY